MLAQALAEGSAPAGIAAAKAGRLSDGSPPAVRCAKRCFLVDMATPHATPQQPKHATRRATHSARQDERLRVRHLRRYDFAERR